MILRVILSVFMALLMAASAWAGSWTNVSGSSPTWLVAGSGSQLFAAAAGGFYISSDGGATWQSSAGPADSPYTALAYFSGGVWMGTQKRGVASGGASGASWTALNTGMILPPFIMDANPISAIAGHVGSSNIVAGQNNGIYLSKDGGSNWSKSATGLPICSVVLGSSIPCAVHDVVAAGSALLAATESGITRSTDGGATWAASGLAGSKVIKLSVGSDAIYALASGLYKSTDSGATWAAVPGLATVPTTIFAHPSTAGTVYAGTSGGSVYQSTDAGASWTQISDGTISGQVYALAVSNDAAGNLLAATAGGIYRYGAAAFDITIPPVSDAALDQYIISEDVTISGLTQVETISIVGGEYSLNEGAFTSAAGKVANGAELRIRVRSAKTYNTSVTATVTIGTRKGQFVVTTSKITRVTNLTEVFETAPEGAEIDADGKVLLSSTTPVALKVNPPAGAIIQTTSGTGVTANQGTLTITDEQGGSTLTFQATTTGNVPQVSQGTYGVTSTASGNVIAVGNISTPALVTVTSNQGGLTINRAPTLSSVSISNGVVNLQFNGLAAGVGGGFAATTSSTSVYGGETAEVNDSGALKRLRIGSLNGDKNIPGDPITLAQVTADTTVPKLDGDLARLDNAASLLTVIQEALNGQFGVTSSQINYDKTNGVVSYVAAGKTYRFIPLGVPTVQVGGTVASVRGNRFSASNAANTASGAFSLASRGIQLTLGSALAYFDDLSQALKPLDPNATIRLRSNGVLQLDINAVNYIAAPGSQSSGGGQTGAPAFVTDSSGFVAFRDSTGATQILYPAFADITTLDATIKTLAPTSSTTASGDGTALLLVDGSSMTLLPQYVLSSLPAAHTNDLWWQEGAMFYIRYPDSTAQGFTAN